MSTDKLADTIARAADDWLDDRTAAARVREAFVVIDRDDLPKVTVHPVYGDLRSGPTSCLPERTGDVRRWALGYLAIAEYVDSNPPVVVDEKAVGELAQWMGALYAGVSTNEAQWNARLNLARRLVADGWKREAKP